MSTTTLMISLRKCWKRCCYERCTGKFEKIYNFLLALPSTSMQTSRRTKSVKSKSAKTTWSRSHVADGVIEITCRGWPSFVEFLNTYVVDTTDYIWRGQRCSDWPLIPSLDRILSKIRKTDTSEIHEKLLGRFKLAVRGRLERAARPESENEWWALGQHFGLATQRPHCSIGLLHHS